VNFGEVKCFINGSWFWFDCFGDKFSESGLVEYGQIQSDSVIYDEIRSNLVNCMTAILDHKLIS